MIIMQDAHDPHLQPHSTGQAPKVMPVHTTLPTVTSPDPVSLKSGRGILLSPERKIYEQQSIPVHCIW